MLYVLNLQDLNSSEEMTFNDLNPMNSNTSLMLCSICCSSHSILAC